MSVQPYVAKHTPGFTHIERRADNNFRGFLLRVSPFEVGALFTTCFANGPRRGGAAEALRYYENNPQHPEILSTVPVIEECERFMPGIQQWLGETGFGDDLDMIKAFARWAVIGTDHEQFAMRGRG